MRILVLTGEDSWAVRARRTEEIEACGAAPSGVERFDLSEDGGASLLRAASTMSLFGGPRVLVAEPAAALSDTFAEALSQAHTDVTVILWGAAALPAAVRRALGEAAQVVTFPVPRGRAVDARIDAFLLQSGIRLTSTARAALIARAGEDMPRALSTLGELANMGMLDPTDAQVERLLGASRAQKAPWVLADALEAGDLAGALEMASGLDPIATVNYLSSRVGQIARVVDEGVPGDGVIAAWFGWTSTHQASKLSRMARRLGREGIAQSWDLIAAADRAAKLAADGSAVLDILLVKLCRLWGAGVPAPR